MGETTDRVRPFANGSEYMDWTAGNCEAGCRKAFDWDKSRGSCPIEIALSAACMGDGTIARSIAERAGLHARPWPERRCREFEPVPADPDVEPIRPARGQLALFGGDPDGEIR